MQTNTAGKNNLTEEDLGEFKDKGYRKQIIHYLEIVEDANQQDYTQSRENIARELASHISGLVSEMVQGSLLRPVLTPIVSIGVDKIAEKLGKYQEKQQQKAAKKAEAEQKESYQQKELPRIGVSAGDEDVELESYQPNKELKPKKKDPAQANNGEESEQAEKSNGLNIKFIFKTVDQKTEIENTEIFKEEKDLWDKTKEYIGKKTDETKEYLSKRTDEFVKEVKENPLGFALEVGTDLIAIAPHPLAKIPKFLVRGAKTAYKAYKVTSNKGGVTKIEGNVGGTIIEGTCTHVKAGDLQVPKIVETVAPGNIPQTSVVSLPSSKNQSLPQSFKSSPGDLISSSSLIKPITRDGYGKTAAERNIVLNAIVKKNESTGQKFTKKDLKIEERKTTPYAEITTDKRVIVGNAQKTKTKGHDEASEVYTQKHLQEGAFIVYRDQSTGKVFPNLPSEVKGTRTDSLGVFPQGNIEMNEVISSSQRPGELEDKLKSIKTAIEKHGFNKGIRTEALRPIEVFTKYPEETAKVKANESTYYEVLSDDAVDNKTIESKSEPTNNSGPKAEGSKQQTDNVDNNNKASGKPQQTNIKGVFADNIKDTSKTTEESFHLVEENYTELNILKFYVTTILWWISSLVNSAITAIVIQSTAIVDILKHINDQESAGKIESKLPNIDLTSPRESNELDENNTRSDLIELANVDKEIIGIKEKPDENDIVNKEEMEKVYINTIPKEETKISNIIDHLICNYMIQEASTCHEYGIESYKNEVKICGNNSHLIESC